MEHNILHSQEQHRSECKGDSRTQHVVVSQSGPYEPPVLASMPYAIIMMID